MINPRRILSFLLALALLTSAFLCPVFAGFDDVSEDAWYAQSVEYVEINGLFRGVSETDFGPGDTMTRGMFVTVLYRACREMSIDFPDPGFTDVVAGSYYSVPVCWGTAAGIINGIAVDTFAPKEPVTREQMCKLICLFCQYLGITLPVYESDTVFTDADSISSYAAEWVDACQKAGLISGYPDGSFQPQGQATRAEVAAIISRLGAIMEDAGYVVGPGNPAKDWRMILVNPWNTVPEGYVDSLSLTYIAGSERVDSRIYDDYKALIAAMKAAGLSPYVNSAYRTNSYQRYLYNNQVSKFLGYGYSRATAEELAAKWVAVPGTSEHELGLAIDFNMYMSSSTAVHTWLKNNAHEYGFIYRYQADKTDKTGINPESWHYRYVGRDNAIRITESGLCLEEYWELYG